MKKKKSSKNPDWDSISDAVKRFLTVTENQTDDSSWPNPPIVDMDALDSWCVKMLKSNQNVKYIKNKPYPYTHYTLIETMLKKYGVDMIQYLKTICPVRNAKISDINDAIAYNIHFLKIDPHSIMDIPTYQSLWDKISDKGDK